MLFFACITNLDKFIQPSSITYNLMWYHILIYNLRFCNTLNNSLEFTRIIHTRSRSPVFCKFIRILFTSIAFVITLRKTKLTRSELTILPKQRPLGKASWRCLRVSCKAGLTATETRERKNAQWANSGIKYKFVALFRMPTMGNIVKYTETCGKWYVTMFIIFITKSL